MINKLVSPIGDDWDDLRKTLLTAEERAKTDTKITILSKVINARQVNGLKQTEEYAKNPDSFVSL